jgi:hypothetical protein
VRAVRGAFLTGDFEGGERRGRKGSLRSSSCQKEMIVNKGLMIFKYIISRGM